MPGFDIHRARSRFEAERTPRFGGDSVLRDFESSVKNPPEKRPLAGLSVHRGVYWGNHDGAWVDETTIALDLSPTSKRGLPAETVMAQWPMQRA